MDADRTQLVGIAFASRDGAVRSAALRAAVASALGERARSTRARDGLAVALCEITDREDRRAVAERARAKIASGLADPTLVAGVSAPRRAGAGADLAMLQAEQTALVGRALRGDGRTTTFDELGPYCFVLGQPTRDIDDFCQRVLGPLADDEDARHIDLARALDAYLRLHGSVNAVARDLSLHRNTVRQRLRRIAKVTGADLKDAEARLGLHLALLGRRALAGLRTV